MGNNSRSLYLKYQNDSRTIADDDDVDDSVVSADELEHDIPGTLPPAQQGARPEGAATVAHGRNTH